MKIVNGKCGIETVGQLIAALQQYPSGLPVRIIDHETAVVYQVVAEVGDWAIDGAGFVRIIGQPCGTDDLPVAAPSPEHPLVEEAKILAEVKARLASQGYDGLYYPGDCACSLDFFAPCGNCKKEDGEEWINGCEAGYKHIDPRNDLGEFVISASKTTPTPEEFDQALIG